MATQTKKITFDTAALFLGRVSGLLLGVVRLSYLARYLGVSNFGVLNAAVYFTSVFQSLFDLGLSQLLIRELSRDRSQSNDLLGTAVLLKLLVVASASVIVGIATLLSQFDATTNWAILFTTFALALNGVSMLFLSAFQAHRRMILVSAASIVNDILLSGTIILLVPGAPGLTTVLILTAAASVANCIFLMVMYRRIFGKLRIRTDRKLWKVLLMEGAPMAVSSLGVSTYIFIGPTILKFTRGDTEVGIYSAGYKLISILTLIPTVFTQVLYPIFSDFAVSARHKLQKALEDSLRVMFLISIPLAVGTTILAAKIIAAIYPPTFSGASFVLQVVIIGNALGYLAWVIYTFLLSLGRQRFCMWNSLIIGVIVLGSGLLFVPRYGYPAVAVIMTGSEIALFLSLILYTGRMGYHPRNIRTGGKILAAAAIMGGILLALGDWPLIPSIVLGGATYAVVIYALRALGDQERELITKILQR
jgi:O-antigen/teichoic acid export membrane protein